MKQHPKNKKVTKKRHPRFIWKLFSYLLLLALAGAALLAIAILTIYPKLPSMDQLQNYQPKLPLQVYTSDGLLLGKFGQEKRIFISFNSTPKMLVNAIISAEDERFYQHGAVDYIGVSRALLSNIFSGHIRSGASTLTMQVARNFFLSTRKTYTRKFTEALLAYKLEQSLTKNQILGLYINQIYLGQRAYGFAEASLTYFGKPLDQLSIAQYAVLAGLPKAPSAYNPIVNPKRSKERQLYVLKRMLVNGYIDQAQYETAVAAPLQVKPAPTSNSVISGGYIAEMVRDMLYNRYGDSIYTRGYKVYTTIDSRMQHAAYVSLRNGLFNYEANFSYQGAYSYIKLEGSHEQQISNIQNNLANLDNSSGLLPAVVIYSSKNKLTAIMEDGTKVSFNSKELRHVRSYLNPRHARALTKGAVIWLKPSHTKYSISQIPKVQGALVALNPNDGAIQALVGGFDYKLSKFNHVTQAYRQVGSGFKPFIYSAALNQGYQSNSLVDDSPICFATGSRRKNSEWCPRNDDRDFLGSITFRQALSQSRNVPTTKIFNQIGIDYAIDFISKHFGFDKEQIKPYVTTALGTTDATPLQVARAYAVFANGGYLVEPYLIKNITDYQGNLLARVEKPNLQYESPILDPRNAFVINSMLQDVIRYGTGSRAYASLQRPDIAGKTGTTSKAKDVWFNGYSPKLVAITWVGYDQPKSLGKRAYGANIALPIWTSFMQSVLPGIPVKQLAMPDGLSVDQGSAWDGQDEYIYNNPPNMDEIENSLTNNQGEKTTAIEEYQDESDQVSDVPDDDENGSDDKADVDTSKGVKIDNLEDLINKVNS